MYFLKFLSELFNGVPEKRKANILPRRQVKDVRQGQPIRIEYHRFVGGIGMATCLSNDPKTKKIFLEIKYTNHPTQNIILSYGSNELKNFHLLNQSMIKNDSLDDNFDLATLQKRINEAIEKEQYEEAERLQNRVNEILKKT